MNKKTRAHKAGVNQGKALVETIHLMYQNRTISHYLRGLNEEILKEMDRRNLINKPNNP